MSQAKSESTEIIDRAEEFYRNYYRDELGKLAQKYPKDQKSLFIDWSDLHRFDPDLADDFLRKPEQMREYFEEALQLYDLPVDVSFSDAHVRVTNIDDGYQFAVGETRKDHRGKFVEISGQVVKRSKMKIKVQEAAYECQRCGTLTRVPQRNGDMQEPHECQGCERQGPFRLNTDQSEMTDHQMIRIKQPPGQADGAEGASIDVVLEDDITDTVESGDRITASGILKLEDTGDKDSPTFDVYLDGVDTVVEQTDYEEIDVSEYEDRIEEIAADNPIEKLRESLAPGHLGDEHIKEALLLQMFGGLRSHHPNGELERGDSHVLLMGDPGCGKSSLLGAVENIAPRATFSSGKGASAAGMTAAAVRDDFGDSEWNIEAGALAIANKGIACVDEIDKVQDEAVDSLHSALEKQVINVSKAGINATLEAQTSLLAAGNPKYGRFDQYEPIGEQINIAPTLMSRFDLMFMLTDEPDSEADRELAQHRAESRREAHQYTHDDTVDEDDVDKISPDVEPETMRAYIAHAKQNLNPYVPEELDNKVVEWYDDLRQSGGDGDDGPVPVTARKIEAVMRIAEASARARLSPVVEEEDIKRAGKLTMESMRQVGIDPETGEFDADVIETGMSNSQRDRVQNVLGIIAELEEEYDKGAPFDVIIERAMDLDMGKNQTEHEITKLSQQGEIYEPATDHYRTSDKVL